MQAGQGRRVEVHRYHPRRRLLARIFLCIGLFAVAAMLYWAGTRAGRSDAEAADALRDALEVELQAQREENRTLEQQVRNLATNVRVEQAASSQVRSDLAAAQMQVERLRQEAELYRSLMDSKARSSGLSVHSLQIRPLDSSGAYRFRLTLLQRAVKHVELVGDVRLSLAGELDGKPETLRFEQITQPRMQEPTQLRFVYFQFVEGELHLPKGFVPSQVQIAARITRGRPQALNVSRAWQVEEA